MAEPATLKENIAEYEKMQARLEADHWGEHVVFYDREFRGAFKEFHQAMRFAYTRWGRGPYLIREVGAPPMRLPPIDRPMWFHDKERTPSQIHIRHNDRAASTGRAPSPIEPPFSSPPR